VARDVKRKDEAAGEGGAKRSYRSERRTEQALVTRRSIREAARSLFAERGYAATSIAAIADEARVAPETVYAIFKNKRALLREVRDVDIVGDDAPVALVDRPFMEAARNAPDQATCLRIVTRASLEATASSAAVGEIVRSAAATDPEIAALWREQEAGRYADTRRFVELVAERGPLRISVEQAADLAWALGSGDVCRRLVVERGWTASQYVDVMTAVMERLALPDN
jgi:AcrR family transcriptional regulator